jgi:Mn2+/Fe2+ NRAMP family transporter
LTASTSSRWRLGPGIVLAATGAGAGDLIAAAVAGTRFGTLLLWAAVVGAVLKFALSEGLARWQLATGTTLLEGWIQRLPGWVSWYFLIYLLLWSFVVAGALIAACGLAAHALFPALSVPQWGVVHSLVAAALVAAGRYALLEPAMKLLIALMFATVLVCAALATPAPLEIIRGLLRPQIPPGSVVFILGVIGGVGGSVTLLSYGYWIRERRWTRPEHLYQTRWDLAVAYGLTGLFGIGVMVIAAGVRPEEMAGPKMALALAAHMETLAGPVGKWFFLGGFWAAVFSSMLGVWQGIPYLFADFVGQHRRQPGIDAIPVDTRSWPYRGYLAYLSLPPMVLLLAGKPVWVVVIYAVAGAFFMPLLAALLLMMNNRAAWVGGLRNGLAANGFLVIALVLFGALLLLELQGRWSG